MARARKTVRKPRRKAVKIQLIPRPERSRNADPACPYTYLDAILKNHPALDDAKIACAWMLDVKADRDGIVVLGSAKKQTDLDRECAAFDIIIKINATTWKVFNEGQRAALMDHFLCESAVATDKNGDPVLDERGRKCYRRRKPEIIEYEAVVRRHGLYTRALAEFARAIEEAPLFPMPEAAPVSPPSNEQLNGVMGQVADAVNAGALDSEGVKATAKASGEQPGQTEFTGDDSWRAVPINEALNGLPNNAYKGMDEKGITTMGEFADFQAKHGDFWSQQINGIGPATVEKICDAAETFWANRQQAAPAA